MDYRTDIVKNEHFTLVLNSACSRVIFVRLVYIDKMFDITVYILL